MEEQTGVAPAALANQPVLEDTLLGRYRTYLEIAKDRGYTMAGPLPISNRNILDYFSINAVPRDEWADVQDFIGRIDSVWLSVQEEAAAAAKTAAETPAQAPVRRARP